MLKILESRILAAGKPMQSSARVIGWSAAILVGLVAPLLACSSSAISADSQATIAYPETRVVAQVDMHFGTAVKDPYRWLESDIRSDREVRAWVDKQSELSRSYLTSLPSRDGFKHRLEHLWNFEKFGLPQRAGNRIFFERNSGLQNQAPLYVQENAVAAPRLLLDPNGWSPDATASLAQWAPSPTGKQVAYAVQRGGSDWLEIHVVDTASGKDLADTVRWVKYSRISWQQDGSGFYYSRFPEPMKGSEFQAQNLNQAVYFHQIGERQENDRLIHSTPDRPKLGHYAEASHDGRYLVVTSWEGSGERQEIAVQDLRAKSSKPSVLIPGYENNWTFAGSAGSTLYFTTNSEAPRYRIVSIDMSKADPAPRTVVAEAQGTLTAASLVDGRLIASYLEDAKSVVRLFASNGTPSGRVALPGLGTASGFVPQWNGDETFFTYSSINMPTTVYRLVPATGATSEFKRPKTVFNPKDYVVRQVFYRSKDGTRIPMFISYRRGMNFSRGAPTLLYGYGGFNVPQNPAFSLSRFAWMDFGGVYVLANIRGGGEYGRQWHDGGRLGKKQNVFDDFISAAEYLVAEGITTPKKLAIHGGSNGGLLVAAVVNQRPELFAAALPLVGVFDMTRFDKFTAGRFWRDDFGDPTVEKDFRNLLSYSPYHNIRPGVPYPAILVITADTDDRVVPAHSFKYAAALQAASLGPKPRLLRIEKNVGHSAGKPISKIIEEVADMWAFAAYHTGLSVSSDDTVAGSGRD